MKLVNRVVVFGGLFCVGKLAMHEYRGAEWDTLCSICALGSILTFGWVLSYLLNTGEFLP